MDKKRTKKGFTLIELIIVMAVFGILMIAVMSIISPLTKIVKKASLQQANNAAVDNVKRYMEGSIRYADCIEVYVGDFSDFNGNDISVPAGLDKETYVARNFVENHYMNRTNKGTEDPLTGKVRMLKIDNADGGRITEYEWNFKSGYTYIQFDGTGNRKMIQDTDINGNPIYDNGVPVMVEDYGVEHAVLSGKSVDTDVINPVYYKDYSFYFQPGYNVAQTITDKDLINSIAGFDTSKDKPDIYYSSIVPVEMASGARVPNFSPELFSLTVMTYKKDGAFGEVLDDVNTAEDESQTIFRSPFAVSNVNMSLVNINSAFSSNKSSDLYGPVRWSGKPSGKPDNYTPLDKIDVAAPKDGYWDYEAINDRQARLINKRFYCYPEKEGDCIYFVYTLPDME